jgi:hypothetical protein
MADIKMEEFTDEEQALIKSSPYVMKPLQDWHFKDVLHFFKASVTNDKACIKTISEREVDGALIASMNDKEMEVETLRLLSRVCTPRTEWNARVSRPESVK